MIDQMNASTRIQPETATQAAPPVARANAKAHTKIRQATPETTERLARSATGRASAVVSFPGAASQMSGRQKAWIVAGVTVAGAAIGIAVGYLTGGRVKVGNQAVNRIISATTSGLFTASGAGFITAKALKKQ